MGQPAESGDGSGERSPARSGSWEELCPSESGRAFAVCERGNRNCVSDEADMPADLLADDLSVLRVALAANLAKQAECSSHLFFFERHPLSRCLWINASSGGKGIQCALLF
jgi:hypothetical protein